MTPLTAALVSSRYATLVELQTVLGVKDAYDLLEILNVTEHNRRVANGKDDN